MSAVTSSVFTGREYTFIAECLSFDIKYTDTDILCVGEKDTYFTDINIAEYIDGVAVMEVVYFI